MNLNFNQIDQILQIASGVGEDRAVAFRARLRNLMRTDRQGLRRADSIELPSKARGKRANYHPADLFKLAFAIEMLQFGLTTDPATLAVAVHWPDAVEGLFITRKSIQDRSVRPRYLAAQPNALESSAPRFKLVSQSELIGILQESPYAPDRLLVINLTAMFSRLWNAARQVGIDMDAFGASLDADQAIILEKGARV